MEQYNVTGMSCAACSTRVEKAVSKVPGVTSCSVSLLTNSMGIEGTASPESIIKAVEDAGYGASKKGAAQNSTSPNIAAEDALKDRETPKLKKRLIASVGFLAVLMYISMGHMMGWPLPEQTKAYEGLVAMRKAALAAVRPGATCADLYAAMLDAAERAGVTPVTGVHWGHGIGVASQEAPWIAPGDATGLKEGMVLVLNPHVQGPGGTILYSRDTVLLDFNGCKILGWYKDWREPYVASDSYYSGGG